MKELIPQQSNVEQTETIQDQTPVSHKLIGNLHIWRGHSIFELDLNTGYITKIEFPKEETIDLTNPLLTGESPTINKKIFIKENCAYESALNMANAHKKFSRKYGQ